MNELLEGKLFTTEMCLSLHIYHIPVNVCAGLTFVTHVTYSFCDASTLHPN